jgi:hypothetical protein
MIYLYMEKLNYSGNLKQIQNENQLIESVVQIVHRDFGNGNMGAIKNNVELINMLCNVVEDISRSSKIVKKDLFFKIYKRIFLDTTEVDMVFVNNIIDFLHDNKLIKYTSLYRKIINQVVRYFSRKN